MPNTQHFLKRSAEMKHMLASLAIGGCLLLPIASVALGAGKTMQTPTTGQRGSPNFTCTTSGAGNNTPSAGANTAQGSPFNASGQAGLVYAGNPDTASFAHANSTAAVSQYDVACMP
jgi:hypothetical protein